MLIENSLGAYSLPQAVAFAAEAVKGLRCAPIELHELQNSSLRH